MSKTPLLINGHRWRQGMKPLLVQDYLNPITYREYMPLGRDDGEIAIECGISREEQDAITVVKKRISCDVHIINDGGLK